MVKLLLLLLTVGTCSWAQLLVSPPSRNCQELEAMDESFQAVRQLPEYVAGEEMLVKAQVPHVEEGVFEFYLCPKTGPGDEDCLMRWPLEISGVEGRQYKIDKFTQGGEYHIPLIIPDDFTCDACTLKWTLVTEQCAPEDGVDGAGSSCSNQRTTLCSDISIVERIRRQKRNWDYYRKVLAEVLRGANQPNANIHGANQPNLNIHGANQPNLNIHGANQPNPNVPGAIKSIPNIPGGIQNGHND